MRTASPAEGETLKPHPSGAALHRGFHAPAAEIWRPDQVIICPRSAQIREDVRRSQMGSRKLKNPHKSQKNLTFYALSAGLSLRATKARICGFQIPTRRSRTIVAVIPHVIADRA